jgi:hypothetical protein
VHRGRTQGHVHDTQSCAVHRATHRLRSDERACENDPRGLYGWLKHGVVVGRKIGQPDLDLLQLTDARKHAAMVLAAHS